MLSAETTLAFPDDSRIRLFHPAEASALADRVRKHNVYARSPTSDHFYIRRIKELSNHTIIEVFRPGEPKDMAREAEKAADLAEKLAVVSSALAHPRTVPRQEKGDRVKPAAEIEFVVGPGCRHFRSRSKRIFAAGVLPITRQFCGRFDRCGFSVLYQHCLLTSSLSERVRTSLGWLFESRRETSLPTAVVKTAIGLESLLIFSESESLSQTLSERTALILTNRPDSRRQVSSIVKRFYDARSGIVHGSAKKQKKLTPFLVEGVDRLCVLILLIIAANAKVWSSVDELRIWYENQRWGSPWTNLSIPFAQSYLNNAIVLAQKAPR
jgi:hypothetical protein